MRKIISICAIFTVCLITIGVSFSQRPFVPGSDIMNDPQAQSELIDTLEKAGGGPGVCGGTKENDKRFIILNTNVPFLKNGRCIEKVFNEGDSSNTNVSNVFPQMMAVLIRITMTILVVGGFLGILVGGFMIASNGAFGTKQTGVKLILGVIAGLILLGASGILLNLINPNFFGAAS